MQKKILQIGSGAESVKLVKTILEAEGHKVAVLCNEKKCLLKIKEEQPDLVLLNVMLPNISAWELYQKIKKLNKDIKIALLSSIPISEERKQDLIESGIADYIMEPFTKEKLVKSVNTMLYE